MIIEKATANDNEILTEITKKSKAYWGYSKEQIEIWSEFLTVTKAYIETNSVYKVVYEDKIVGYYSFFNEEVELIKLDNLFVLPEYIGKGFGKILMYHFLTTIKGIEVAKITLNAEPNAELFYAKFGFVTVRQIETSIQNRFLPVMELILKNQEKQSH